MNDRKDDVVVDIGICCTQCGEDTEELYEGFCEDCCNHNQVELDFHNASFDRWESLDSNQREAEIKHAVNLR